MSNFQICVKWISSTGILIPLFKDLECHTNCSKENNNEGFKSRIINENTIS